MSKAALYKALLILIVFAFSISLFIGDINAEQSILEYKDDHPQININKVFSRRVAFVGELKVNNDFDYRIEVLNEYFSRHNSPLEGYGKNYIDACEKYGAPKDCTLLPAIGYIETRNCTLDLSSQQKNCWGWGGAGENRVLFDNYEQAIDKVMYYLMEIPFYGTEFFNDPVYAQYYYCGTHCDMWGTHVQNAREDINELAVEMGYPPMF